METSRHEFTEFHERLDEHERRERLWRKDLEKMVSTRLKDYPTRADLEGLAKTSDIQEILVVFKNLDLAAGIIKGGANWSFRILLILAAVVAALTTIFGGWKLVIAWFIGDKTL